MIHRGGTGYERIIRSDQNKKKYQKIQTRYDTKRDH